MSRFRNASGSDGDESSIDISPLIDVVFILLIFFIVTTTFVEESGLEVNRPDAASASQQESDSLVFEITEKGGILHKGREIGLQGIRGLVEEQLRTDDAPVIVEAAENARTEVMIRVVDEIKLAGGRASLSPA
jgi:biopolymer transport protein ExbD